MINTSQCFNQKWFYWYFHSSQSHGRTSSTPFHDLWWLSPRPGVGKCGAKKCSSSRWSCHASRLAGMALQSGGNSGDNSTPGPLHALRIFSCEWADAVEQWNHRRTPRTPKSGPRPASSRPPPKPRHEKLNPRIFRCQKKAPQNHTFQHTQKTCQHAHISGPRQRLRVQHTKHIFGGLGRFGQSFQINSVEKEPWTKLTDDMVLMSSFMSFPSSQAVNQGTGFQLLEELD